MIVPSDILAGYINAYQTRDEFCDRFEIDPATIRRYLNKEQTCSASFIEKVKEITGMDFEKSFDIVEDVK